MAKVNMAAPVNAAVLSLDEQRRALESDRRAHLETIERQKLDYQRAAALGDTARMESAQMAADNSAATVDLIDAQLETLAAAAKKAPSKTAKSTKKRARVK